MMTLLSVASNFALEPAPAAERSLSKNAPEGVSQNERSESPLRLLARSNNQSPLRRHLEGETADAPPGTYLGHLTG